MAEIEILRTYAFIAKSPQKNVAKSESNLRPLDWPTAALNNLYIVGPGLNRDCYSPHAGNVFLGLSHLLRINQHWTVTCINDIMSTIINSNVYVFKKRFMGKQ